MNNNPSINELQQSGRYKLIAELSHTQIKEFVLGQISGKNKLVRVYMYYQSFMVVLGVAFAVWAIAGAFKGTPQNLKNVVASVIFSFSILILLHELLHGLALKIAGAPKVRYGAYLRKFIFYAEADHFVLNRKQFAQVALTPLVVVKVITLVGFFVYFNHPLMYFFIMLMSLHSLFCTGDILLLSVFYIHEGADMYTFDIRRERKSYYYIRSEEADGSVN